MYCNTELGFFEYKWKMKYYSDNKIRNGYTIFIQHFYSAFLFVMPFFCLVIGTERLKKGVLLIYGSALFCMKFNTSLEKITSLIIIFVKI